MELVNIKYFTLDSAYKYFLETKLREATQKATDERMSEVESHVDDVNGRLNLRFVH